MPKGYVVARISVVDPEGYKAYVAAASEAIKKYGGKPLVRGGRSEILEGEARARNVIIEFESFDQAKAYYYSDEYQAAIKHRLSRGIADIVVVEGV
jgi:uncharacterized protein (DUF1330 family)